MMILLTGHEGYIGSNLLKTLIDKGYKVRTFHGDILDAHEDDYKFDNYTAIIHLAAWPGVRASFDDPDGYLRNNVDTTRKLFRIAESTGAPIFYASSSNAKEWWKNPYATTKRINELDALKYDIKSVGMRFHTVWPGRPDMLYQRLINKEVDYINIGHYRDWIHVDDLCSAICTMIEKRDIIFHESDKVVRDIGTGHSTPVADVAHNMGYEGEYVNDPTPSERTITLANVEWLHQLGWGPKRNILNENSTTE
jgi:nucleoside-diphosphate-sugar epimerase